MRGKVLDEPVDRVPDGKDDKERAGDDVADQTAHLEFGAADKFLVFKLDFEWEDEKSQITRYANFLLSSPLDRVLRLLVRRQCIFRFHIASV